MNDCLQLFSLTAFDSTLNLAVKLATGEIPATDQAAYEVDIGVIKIGECLEEGGAMHWAVVLLDWFEPRIDVPHTGDADRARYAGLAEFLRHILASTGNSVPPLRN